jgi:hypothetical protein
MATAPQIELRNTETVPVRADRSPIKSVTVRLVDAGHLRDYEEAWWKLSDCAVVPNAYYDPWMLLPAIELHAKAESLHFLLVFGPTGKDGVEPLWGFFPLEVLTKCLHLPIRTLAFWQHRNCWLTAPLIDRDRIREVLDAFWRWFESNPLGCRILDTNYLPADGPFHAVWADFAIGRSSLMLRDFPRAFFAASGTAESYISKAVSKKHSDTFLRQKRRLSELGKLEYHQVESLEEIDAWLDDFMKLEVSGWKGGVSGNALAKERQDADYFRTFTREGFQRHRVLLLSLVLDGKAIAMKQILLAGGGGFVFRITYDETYAKYSPGLLLELENMRRAWDGSQIKWMDSCANPRHPLFNRIWSERRMLRRTLFSNSSRLSDFWIAVVPLLRWIKKRIKREEPADYLQISTQIEKQ